MQNRRAWLRVAGVGAIVALALGLASPAWPQNCSKCKITNLFLPLSGLFSWPPDPILPSGENVLLTGDVHVVARVEAVVGAQFLTDIYLNMAGVTGTGQTTGGMYIGTGSNKYVNIDYPPTTVIPPDPIHANFSLEAARRSGSVQLPLTFDLRFGTDGTLLPSSTVSVTSD